MRRFFLFILILPVQLLFSQDINNVRDLYLQAGMEREKTTQLLNAFTKLPTASILKAYNATALTMYADLVNGRFNKLKYFLEGKEMLEQAIELDKTSVEMRFLRFSIQTNIPAILNYDDIDDDKLFILSNLHKVEEIEHQQIREALYKTLLNSGELIESEKEKVLGYLK